MQASTRLRLAGNGVAVDFAGDRLVDAHGAPVPLRPQAFAVLRLLASRPGEVVGKSEIMATVWPGIAVTDDSLVQAIGDIRRAIGDDRHAVLRTAPRRGYKLVPPEAAASLSPWRRRWRVAAAAAALLALAAGGTWWLAPRPGSAGVPLVAVLPFTTVSDDAAARRLADGLTEDVITDLARFPEFEVLAGGATAPWRGRPADPRTVGAALGAGFVVAGSIDRDAERVRIAAQLHDAGDGRSLWANRWDRPAADVFAIQAEIAETIANRLGGGAGLVQETGRIAARRKAPANLSAYELYLLGTERLEQVTQPEVEAALDLLTRSVELDPGLARAWIEIFHCRGLLANFGADPARNRELAYAAATRALALDPSDAEAHAVYASALGERNDFVRAEVEFDTALRLAPNAAEILIFYIGWASTFGEPERGADLVERAIRLDPNYPTWANRPFANANFMAGRYAKAVAFFERLGTERHNRWSWAAHAGALAALGRRDEAAALVAQALAAYPELSIELIVNEPGWSEAEHRRFAETMRLAGFPPCAGPEALAEIVQPVRLPECGGGRQAEARTNSLDAKPAP